MLRFVFRKMISKKWMVLALLIGNILLVAITATNPMYTQASLQRTLETSFQTALAEKNKYPFTVTVTASRTSQVFELEQILPAVVESYGIPLSDGVVCFETGTTSTESNLEREDRKTTSLALGSLSNLNDHITIIEGTLPSTAPDADGIIDVAVSQGGMVSMNLLLGEILTFTRLTEEGEEPFRVRIAGVFRNSDSSDTYWVKSPAAYSQMLFMDENLFREIFVDGGKTVVKGTWYLMFDYLEMDAAKAQDVLDLTAVYAESIGGKTGQEYRNNFEELLTEFVKTSRKVSTTLWVLQVPIYVLLVAFLFLVAWQMMTMEQAEIAVLRSRGVSRIQIIGIYLLESLITAAIAVLIGLPISPLLVQVLGSSNSFLEFVGRRALSPVYTAQVFAYVGVAVLVSVITMLIPVVLYSRQSIVNQKQTKSRKTRNVSWQRLVLDLAVLGISLYGLFTFNNQKEYLAEQVLEGASLDPLLFLSSSLFMLGAGLVAMRLIPLFVSVIFYLFQKKMSPAVYASFLRVMRAKDMQGFIMVFLIMTIALGIFDATAARTVNSNEERNRSYMDGADIVFLEKWKDNSGALEQDPSLELEYTEPDYNRYTKLPEVESITKVLVDNGGTINVSGGAGKIQNIKIMGIHTKEFGETAWFDPELLPRHWYEYLNAISQDARAILVSSNFHEKYGYNVGDVINYKGRTGSWVSGIIYGFVDYWPGYNASTWSRGSDGLFTERSNYLIVANLSQLQAAWGITPYQVWMKTGRESQFLYRFAEEEGIEFRSFTDTAADIVELKNDPLIQGTNGMLTVGFIVVLILCTVGFLIYWILSIRSRELQFGIFRAMGMSMREIITMLLVEHVFISGLSIAAGAFVGWLTGKLFMPLIQIAYSSYDMALPLVVQSEAMDHIRLAVIITVMILACLTVLATMIRRMKIAQALKLGED